MYKIIIAIMLLMLLTGAVEDGQTASDAGGCATAGDTVIHVSSPDSQTTPSYFEGRAQSLEDSK